MAGRASSEGFIARNGLWGDGQEAEAAEILRRVEADGLRLVRLAWVDSHGAVRAKAVTPPALCQALVDGYNINVATSTLDASGGRVFASFTPGGGMGIDEMTGSPNLVLVPDPGTFRTLPWAPGTGWVLGDSYFRDGKPFPFSTRRVLARQRARLAERGWRMLVGIEIEWYLRRIDDDRLGDAEVAHQGRRGRPLATSAVEPGFSYHSETNLDIMQPVFDALADAFAGLGLKLRSLENEFGPGQVECTFAADDAGRAADDAALFRSAARQVCRRLGYAASFICRPAFEGHFASGWHLHQSFVDAATGGNLFMPADGNHALSPLGLSALAGLIEHAGAASAFVTPTVNGYRRFRPNSLAPDRAGWGVDQRGAMMRVIGGAGDPATRLENRAGEPAANPYLYIASQIAAALDGIDRNLAAPAEDLAPYEAERERLPADLDAALGFLDASALFRREFGDPFVDYFLALKRAELGRFRQYGIDRGGHREINQVTEWEQNEYFDFF
ncbi:MAG: glutamine synthetase family protein [Rhodospirillales bacterium]|nr:glutamine synthetase family protein [Rhodospirillales bacterium]MDE0385951.1 glutamine synthetase family protein [Defluviicoccus sp.]